MSEVRINGIAKNHNSANKKYNAETKYISDRQLKQRNATLEGVVVNNFIKNPSNTEAPNLDDTYNALLIPDKNNAGLENFINKETSSKEYDVKKAMFPLIIGTAGVFLASATMGLIVNKAAHKNITEPFKNKLQPMGMNLNIVEETGFASYMALADPTKKNILAAGAVFAFSGITLAAKKFVEAVKEIWVKKQDAQIKRDLQENLIEVETQAFSGKLAVVRDMLSKKGEYFKNAINYQNSKEYSNEAVFTKHFNFTGREETKKEDSKVKKILNPYTLTTAAVLALGVVSAVFSYKNFKKGAQIISEHEKNFIKNKESLLKEILQSKDKDTEKKLMDTLIKMGANKGAAEKYGAQIGLEGEKLQKFANTVACDVDTIWGNAPTGMSTESGKCFFYCYLNEARGHLYNWLIHSDNVFLKYLFAAMATVSGTSYLAQECADAIKEAAVLKENAKTELGLQKQLINVEINNFKAKKDSAVEPLIEEFERQRKEGKSPQELKIMADNVLLEIKNGPPFVYT